MKECKMKYSDLVKHIHQKYTRDKNKYETKEISRFDKTRWLCFFCLRPIISGYIEFREVKKEGQDIYKIHKSCLDNFCCEE